jgi:hypothetical protein
MTDQKAEIHSALVALDAKGKLTPTAVVTLARNKNSPLHSLFDWNDKMAAAKYRLAQARTIITSFQIRTSTNRLTIHINEFVENPLKASNEQGYVSIQAMVSDEHMAREFIEEQLTIARNYVNKTRAYAELLGFTERVADAVELLDSTIDAVRSVKQPQQSQAAS